MVALGAMAINFLLQGPVSTFVGTTAIRANFEDAPHVENLVRATRSVLITPSNQCCASDCPRGATLLVEGFWFHHYQPLECLRSARKRPQVRGQMSTMYMQFHVTRYPYSCLVKSDHFFCEAGPVFNRHHRYGVLNFLSPSGRFNDEKSVAETVASTSLEALV